MTHRASIQSVLLFGAMALWALPGYAQIAAPPPPPIVQQAMDADQRQGNFFQFNGANIFYQVAGEGTPLILIHGYPLSGDLFKGQLTGLSSHFKVIRLDLPGFGKSTAPNANGSITGYAQYVLALMDQLNIQTAIIGGHSMGGQITLELFKEAPQRFSGMILMDTNPMAASIVEQARVPGFRPSGQQIGCSVDRADFGPADGDRRYTATQRPVSSGIMNIVAEASVNGTIAGGEALATRADYTSLLSSISIPTLVVVGVDDPVYGVSVSQTTASQLPNAQLAIIPAAAHTSMFERPRLVNAAINSWAGQ